MTAAEQVQMDLFRRATPQQRFELAQSLTQQTLELAHRAIERAYPELEPWGQRVKFVAAVEPWARLFRTWGRDIIRR